jgi:hypothetical protein
VRGTFCSVFEHVNEVDVGDRCFAVTSWEEQAGRAEEKSKEADQEIVLAGFVWGEHLYLTDGTCG